MTIWREIWAEVKRGAVEATTDYWKGIKLLWRPCFYVWVYWSLFTLAFDTFGFWLGLLYCLFIAALTIIPPLHWEHTHGGIKLTGPNNKELEWVNHFNSILRSRWKRLRARL